MSAFLAIVLSGIFLLQSTLIFAVKYSGVVQLSQRLLNSSIYSVLAGYDKEIKEKYGLYLLYNGTRVSQNIRELLTENLEYETANQWIRLSLQDLRIETKVLDSLSALEAQILKYSKLKIPLQVIQSFLSRTSSFFQQLNVDIPRVPEVERDAEPDREAELDPVYKDLDKRQAAQTYLKELGNPDRQKEGDSQSEIPKALWNTLPSRSLVQQSSASFLRPLLALLELDIQERDADQTLNQCVDDLLLKGPVSFQFLYNQLLINEYILSQFQSKVDSTKYDTYLKYEIEYILFGTARDQRNQSYTHMAILLIRYLFNALYLYQNDTLCTAAEIASYIATLPVEFQGQPGVKQAILLAWCLIESGEDYRLLEAGKSVALFKEEKTWKTWFAYQKNAKAKISLNYQDYLRILLMLVPYPLKLARILDLIQLNIQQSRTGVLIVQSVYAISADCGLYFGSKRRLSFRVEAEHGYISE